MSHSSYQPDGLPPLAPSAVKPAAGLAQTPDWREAPFETPREISLAQDSNNSGRVSWRRSGTHRKQALMGLSCNAANLPQDFRNEFVGLHGRRTQFRSSSTRKQSHMQFEWKLQPRHFPGEVVSRQLDRPVPNFRL